MGYAFRKQQKYTSALDCYREAVRLQPAYAKAWYNMGYVLDKQGNYEDALAAFNRAMELAPENDKYLASRNAVQATWREFQKVFDVQCPNPTSNASSATSATQTSANSNVSPTMSRDTTASSPTAKPRSSSVSTAPNSKNSSRVELPPYKREEADFYASSDLELSSRASFEIQRSGTTSGEDSSASELNAFATPAKKSTNAGHAANDATNEATFNPFLSFETSSPGGPPTAILPHNTSSSTISTQQHSQVSPLAVAVTILPSEVSLEASTGINAAKDGGNEHIAINRSDYDASLGYTDANSNASSSPTSSGHHAPHPHHLQVALAPIAHAGLPPSPLARSKMMSSSGGSSELIIPNAATTALSSLATGIEESTAPARAESPSVTATAVLGTAETNETSNARISPPTSSVASSSHASSTSSSASSSPKMTAAHAATQAEGKDVTDPLASSSSSSIVTSSIANSTTVSSKTNNSGSDNANSAEKDSSTGMAILMQPPLPKENIAVTSTIIKDIGVVPRPSSTDEGFLKFAIVPTNPAAPSGNNAATSANATTSTTNTGNTANSKGKEGSRRNSASSASSASAVPPTHLSSGSTSSSHTSLAYPKPHDDSPPTSAKIAYSHQHTSSAPGAMPASLRTTGSLANLPTHMPPVRGGSGLQLPHSSSVPSLLDPDRASHTQQSHHPHHIGNRNQASFQNSVATHLQVATGDKNFEASSAASVLTSSDAASLLSTLQTGSASQLQHHSMHTSQQSQTSNLVGASSAVASSSTATPSGNLIVTSPDGSDNEYENRVHVGPRQRTYLEALYTHLQGIKTSREAEKIEIALEEMLEAVKFKRSFLAAKEAQLQATGDEEKCACCWERPPEMVCIPCGHLCICEECKSKLRQKKCPICSQPVKNIYKVFK